MIWDGRGWREGIGKEKIGKGGGKVGHKTKEGKGMIGMKWDGKGWKEGLEKKRIEKGREVELRGRK